MTKEQLRKALENGALLGDLFPPVYGRECSIFKTPEHIMTSSRGILVRKLSESMVLEMDGRAGNGR